MDDDIYLWLDSVEIGWRKRDNEPVLILQLTYENRDSERDEAEDDAL